MPYLKKEYKNLIDENPELVKTAGELNYLLTKLLLEEPPYAVLWDKIVAAVELYVQNRGVSYETYNSVMGVLLCASLEYRRRTSHSVPEGVLADFGMHFYSSVIAPYEDKKIKENGDVYDV